MLSLCRNLIVAAILILMVSGCAQKRVSLPIEPMVTILLEDTPFFAQEEYQCGPAALAMVLGASGIRVQPDALAPLTYIPDRRGSLQLELIGAARNYQRIPFEIEPTPDALVAELKAGRPVLVLQNYGLESLPAYHYAVVIGAGKNEVILRSGTTKELRMGLSKFLITWIRPGSWGLITLKPGELPARSTSERYLQAVNAFEQSGHIQQAELAYLAGLSKWPENPDILFALGNTATLQGNLNDAESYFRSILTTQPDNIAAANNLADTLVKKGCKLQATTVIDMAIQTARSQNSPLLPFVLQTQQEVANAPLNADHSCM